MGFHPGGGGSASAVTAVERSRGCGAVERAAAQGTGRRGAGGRRALPGCPDTNTMLGRWGRDFGVKATGLADAVVALEVQGGAGGSFGVVTIVRRQGSARKVRGGN